jgi:hypothetical protein
MTPAPSLQELIDTVRADAGAGGALDRLSVASATVAVLEETGDALLGYFVDQSRREGHSWTEISAALGVSKQAAHKRFSLAPGPVLERFTPRAQAALSAAADAARELGHNYIGTEHILLGLFQTPESIAAKVLRTAKVTRSKVERAVLAATPRGSDESDDVRPYTPRAADVMTRAIEEALKLGHNYVGTEHILLALLRDPDSLAASVLTDLGASYQQFSAQVIEELSAYLKS